MLQLKLILCRQMHCSIDYSNNCNIHARVDYIVDWGTEPIASRAQTKWAFMIQVFTPLTRRQTTSNNLQQETQHSWTLGKLTWDNKALNRQFSSSSRHCLCHLFQQAKVPSWLKTHSAEARSGNGKAFLNCRFTREGASLAQTYSTHERLELNWDSSRQGLINPIASM